MSQSTAQTATSAPPVGLDTEGLIFDLDTFAIHDGPGIRMTVYLKGCPLTCAWCHSPESQSPTPELVFVPDRCVSCARCVEVCPQGVHVVDPFGSDGEVQTDHGWPRLLRKGPPQRHRGHREKLEEYEWVFC